MHGHPKVINNRYRVHESIGVGAVGQVFHATDTETNQPVAVKWLRPDAVQKDPAMVERFTREGAALRRLNHPNIVALLEAVEEAGQHYLIMEYVPGGDLRKIVRQDQPLEIPRILTIAIELADALTRAHYLRIIHRDLKPANVLIAEDGTPRLTDFGVAHFDADADITQTGVAVGTPNYLSPEALNSQPIDTRADIWAFGVMLFELLTGQRPFMGESVSQIIMNILSRPTPDLEQLRPEAPPALVDLIYRMLEKERAARIPSIRLVGAELETIIATLESGAPPPDAPRFTMTATSETLRHNLPAQTTPFVGREAELTELGRFFTAPENRLVTIVGPGGMGKTRLALELGCLQVEAHQQGIATFPNGVYFVPLAPLDNTENIAAAIAEALDFSFQAEGENHQEQLLAYLHDKHALLILDNFEHLLAGAGLVQSILESAPHIQIMVTSRERLNLSGETVFTLAGMDFPDWQSQSPNNALEEALTYSAVKLFLQSARRTRPDFNLEDADLPHVAQICRLVQGMPLAILLAAAWVEMLTLQEIAQEIAQSIDFLETEMRDMPTRHRSIRAAFDYSWALLTEDEKITFSQLTVFRGGFTRQAAQAVTGTSLRTLTNLMNKSLLRRNPTTGRYEIHELLRQYGDQHLQSDAPRYQETLLQHSHYYMDLLHNLSRDIASAGQKTALEVLDTEIENVRLGWNIAIKRQDVMAIAQAEKTLYYYYRLRSLNQERYKMFERAVHMLEKVTPDTEQQRTLALLLSRQGELGMRVGKSAMIYDNFERSITILRNLEEKQSLCFSLSHYGFILANSTDVAQGVAYIDEAIQLARETNSREEEATAILWRGLVTLRLGDRPASWEYGQAALTLFETLEQPEGIADSYRFLANLALGDGDFERAQPYFAKSLQHFQTISDLFGVAASHLGLAINETARGHYDVAANHADMALKIYTEHGRYTNIINVYASLADMHFLQGHFEPALSYHAQILALLEKTPHLDNTGTAYVYYARTLEALGRLDEATEALQQGIVMLQELDPEMPLMLVWRIRAHLHQSKGDYAQAQSDYRTALKIAIENQEPTGLLYVLLGFAELYLRQGNYAQAAYFAAIVAEYQAAWAANRQQAHAVLEQASQHLTTSDVEDAHRQAQTTQIDQLAKTLLDV